MGQEFQAKNSAHTSVITDVETSRCLEKIELDILVLLFVSNRLFVPKAILLSLLFSGFYLEKSMLNNLGTNEQL